LHCNLHANGWVKMNEPQLLQAQVNSSRVLSKSFFDSEHRIAS